MKDRLTEIRVRGLRSLDDLVLRIGKLTVLIGDNGAGKSSIIEACELLRKAANPNFLQEFNSIHGGFSTLGRHGCREITLGARASGPAGDLDYELTLAPDGIVGERLDLGPLVEGKGPLHAISRVGSNIKVFSQQESKLVQCEVPPAQLAIGAFGALPPQRAIGRMAALLNGINVHIPFDVTPYWVARGVVRRHSPLRDPAFIEPAARLERQGANLASAWHALLNAGDTTSREKLLDKVRLGLGYEVENIVTLAAPGGGQVSIAVKFRGIEKPVLSFGLSDGMLAYLAFVALAQMNSDATLLAVDEPELHLHPDLLVRVTDMLEDLASEVPVVLATHSDRILDALSNPAESAVLCSLDHERRTRTLRPDPQALESWLQKFRGLGELRSAGYQGIVMTKGEDE
ncbi:MAG: AAA family ATPase [Deltaproteobacteria bacterium]|nr:AAA family ATPase [Deltaproteobacteria bacterium]